MLVHLLIQLTIFNWPPKSIVKLVLISFLIHLVTEVRLHFNIRPYDIGIILLRNVLNLNSGLFSERSLEDINECTYDPPYVGKGSAPGWAAGSSKQVEQITDGIPDYSAPASDDYGGYGDDYAYDYRRRRSAGRQKRFDMNAYGKIIICFPEKDNNFFFRWW